MIKRVQGFTLIEVMIVVAIIGIIATIAIPSYQRYVQNSRCELAKADLTELAQFMERRYSTRFDYRAADGTNPALPFNTSARDGNPVAFNIAFDGAVEQTTFTIQATPVAGMVDAITCGTAPLGNILTIDQQGNRSW